VCSTLTVPAKSLTSHITSRTEWTKLREMIKYKIDKVWCIASPILFLRMTCECPQNVSLFLSDSGQPDYSPPRSFSPQPLPHGGLKLPPFPPRQRDGPEVTEAPINFMDEQQASAMKDVVYSQLHEFDE
jgi:serine/threonine-protein phosphatase 4 regulatory subunit 2